MTELVYSGRLGSCRIYSGGAVGALYRIDQLIRHGPLAHEVAINDDILILLRKPCTAAWLPCRGFGEIQVKSCVTPWLR